MRLVVVFLIGLIFFSGFVVNSRGQEKTSIKEFIGSGYDKAELSLVKELAKISAIYQIPTGVEFSLVDSENTAAASSTLIPGTDLKTDLDSLVERFSDYKWKYSGGVILVYPKRSHRDLGLTTFLKARVDYVDMRDKRSVFVLKQKLARSNSVEVTLASLGLTLDLDLDLETDAMPFYRGFSADFRGDSVREILNTIVMRGPVLMWVCGRRNKDKSILYFDFILSADRRWDLTDPLKPSVNLSNLLSN